MTENFVLSRLLLLVPLWISLSVHEWAHAWTARQLGDPTAENEGRLTLNPLAHIDPFGTLLLPLLGVPFGWARPVPVVPSRFRPGVKVGPGMALVAVAGPVSNLVLVALFSILFLALDAVTTLAPVARQGFYFMVVLNAILAVFNLFPVPPLDGSRIVDGLLPENYRAVWDRFYALGPVGLVAILVLPSLFGIDMFGWIFRLAATVLPVR